MDPIVQTIEALAEGVAIATVRGQDTSNPVEFKRVTNGASLQAAQTLQLQDLMEDDLMSEAKSEAQEDVHTNPVPRRAWQPEQDKKRQRVRTMLCLNADALAKCVAQIPEKAKTIPDKLVQKYTTGKNKIGCLLFFVTDAQALVALYKEMTR